MVVEAVERPRHHPRPGVSDARRVHRRRVVLGAFNTALEVTNTETFCTSCHEMHDNVYQELTRTIHFSNRSGVRATCPDCHVPHEWTDKIARKMQASKEVWARSSGQSTPGASFSTRAWGLPNTSGRG